MDASYCTTQLPGSPASQDEDWAGAGFTVVPVPETLDPSGYADAA